MYKKLKKINLLIIGKNSILCKIFLSNSKIKNIKLHSSKEIERINFKNFTHVINFSFNPILKKKKYQKKFDFDIKLLKKIKETNIIYVMISTRLIYSSSRAPLSEKKKYNIPTTNYGKNKLIIENNLKKTLPNSHLILRVSNILYDDIDKKRNLFYYNVLNSLKNKGKVLIDFKKSVFKDFMTPGYFSSSLDKLLLSNSLGVFNLCSGVKIKTIDLIKKIIQGYGSGIIFFTKIMARCNNRGY